MVRICVQCLLKLVNSGIGIVGFAMILYAIWLMRAWQRQTGHFPFEGPDNPVPWFMYTSFGVGFILCAITCLGQVAAETANCCCLYMYMVLVSLLLMVEAGVATDILLNHDWEKDFPEDPSGCFHQFKRFIRLNFNSCQLIGILILSIQVLSLLLAMVLKAMGPHRYYDSDDEYATERVPLLRNALYSPTTFIPSDSVFAPKNDAHSRYKRTNLNDKV